MKAKESPRTSPSTAAPLPGVVKGKAKKVFVVFASRDIRNTWETLDEARAVAEEWSKEYDRSMQIFELVETAEKK